MLNPNCIATVQEGKKKPYALLDLTAFANYCAISAPIRKYEYPAFRASFIFYSV